MYIISEVPTATLSMQMRAEVNDLPEPIYSVCVCVFTLIKDNQTLEMEQSGAHNMSLCYFHLQILWNSSCTPNNTF